MTDQPAPPDLRTRLRELRNSRGWTLAEVARELGTTPQSISRLETNVMTVSTDWLQKFANLFGVSPADLIKAPATSGISVVGAAGADGSISQHPPTPLPVDLALEDAIAIKLAVNLGPYRQGTFVIATRLEGRNIASAKGQICICQTAQGAMWLAHFIDGMAGNATLVPLAGGEVQYDIPLEWAARVRMDLRLSD